MNINKIKAKADLWDLIDIYGPKLCLEIISEYINMSLKKFKASKEETHKARQRYTIEFDNKLHKDFKLRPYRITNEGLSEQIKDK